MKGYSDRQLGGIDVELKEAVCDALVGALVARVSGTDARGATVLGDHRAEASSPGSCSPASTRRGG